MDENDYNRVVSIVTDTSLSINQMNDLLKEIDDEKIRTQTEEYVEYGIEILSLNILHRIKQKLLKRYDRDACGHGYICEKCGGFHVRRLRKVKGR